MEKETISKSLNLNQNSDQKSNQNSDQKSDQNENKILKIRPAENQDNLSIEKILGTYFLDRDDIPVEQFIVAENEMENSKKIIGCACYDISEKGFGEVHTIAVLPSYKDKGIGKLLLNQIMRILSEMAEKQSLSDVVYVRTTAPDFFRHMGFADCENNLKKDLWEECVNCREYEECVQKLLSAELKKN